MDPKTQDRKHPDPPSLLPDVGGTYDYAPAEGKAPAVLTCTSDVAGVKTGAVDTQEGDAQDDDRSVVAGLPIEDSVLRVDRGDSLSSTQEGALLRDAPPPQAGRGKRDKG